MDSESILDCNLFDLADRAFDAYPEAIPFDDFGPYHILQSIGTGGMGEVFLAEDVTVVRRVAIKFLRNVWSEPDLPGRFHREIRTLAGLEHVFIGRLYEYGVRPDGTPWFAMEYIEGKPIDEYCREHNCCLEERMRLFRAVCDAVQYAHGRAVIHLDLKPSNILVKEDGTPKLLDFGIAKHLDDPDTPANQTQLRFTPVFAAPEQILRRPIGTYTDVYALGLVLYQLLAGKLPHNLDQCGQAEAEAAIVSEREWERPSLATNRVLASKTAWSDLDVICLKAVRKDVHRRYQSVVELAQDGDRFLRCEPLKGRPDTLTYRSARFLRRNLKAVIASAATLVLIAALTIFYAIGVTRARDAALVQAARAQRIQRFMLNMLGAADRRAPPPKDLRVLTMLDRAASAAHQLNEDLQTQAELHETLGRMYRMLGKTSQADAQLQLGLDEMKAEPKTSPADLAGLLIEVGNLRGDESNFEQAHNAIQQALSLTAKTGSSGELLSFQAQTVQASLYAKHGSYAKTITILQPLVKIKPPGPEGDFYLSEALNVLGYAENDAGNYEESRLIVNRELELDRRLYGDSHAQIGIDLANLGSIQGTQGHYSQAEATYRNAIKILDAWYGDDEIEVLQDMTSLATLLIQQGKPKEAGPILEHVLAAEATIGKNNPSYAWTLDVMGRLELVSNDLGSAETHLRQSLAIDTATFGENNHRTALVKAHLAQVLVKQRRYAQAEPLLQQSLQALPKNAGNMSVPVIQVLLGQVLVKLKRYAEAEEHLLSGYALLENQHTPPLLKWRDSALENLAIIYAASGQPEKAATFRRQMLTRGDTASH